MSNINTKEYWDEFHQKESSISAVTMYILFNLIPWDSSVIDIGCGHSNLVIRLNREKNCKIYGIDISEFAIKALAKHKIECDVMNAENLDGLNREADIVVISHILEHITNDEGLIRNALRMAKRFVLIAVPNNCMPPEECPEHERMYNKESLTKLLKKYSTQIDDHSSGRHLILKAYV